MSISNTKSTVLVLATTAGLLILAPTKAQESTASPLGNYGKTSTYCGNEAIPHDPPTIPQLGCFYLSSHHTASGTLSTHRVEVSVDDSGSEFFKVDGTLVLDTRNTASETNLTYVAAGGVAGYRFCEGPADRNTGCPASITMYLHNADKSVLFIVSECIAPQYHLCVSTQQNWDYERSRQR